MDNLHRALAPQSRARPQKYQHTDRYDLCLAWNWEYDGDFVSLLSKVCQAQGISFYQVTPTNLDETLQALNDRRLEFGTFFDRASDADRRFLPLVDWALRYSRQYINRFKLAQKAWDKAAMHHLFTRAGLDAPCTFILPPYSDRQELPALNLSLLGECFAIKPSHGGGGKGVIPNATSWLQVLAARQEYPHDYYLVQAYVNPTILDGRPAWFRILYAAGQIYPCWWDPRSHCYTEITEREMRAFQLQPLYEIARRIAQLSQLELFSTEVAHTHCGRFEIVDYINDPIDLRIKSRVAEGVPDDLAERIAQDLVGCADSQAISFAALQPVAA